MTKVVIIGAGSGFGGRISLDILTRMGLKGVEIVLCDIDEKKVETVHKYVQTIIDTHQMNKTAKVWSTVNREQALPNADFVMISVAIGGPAYYGEPFDSEFTIPLKYGIIQTVADTAGPGAIFRALRTAPEMIRMVNDINRLAPKSMILNLTNPMSVLTWTLSKYTKVPIVGLCHGVTGNFKRLADILKIPQDEVSFICAGINHMTWFIDFRHNGVSVMEELRKAVRQNTSEKATGQNYFYRTQVMDITGYFTTESDRHIPEYLTWFQTGDNSSLKEYAKITRGIKDRRHAWYEDMGVTIESRNTVELGLSHESASGIIEAVSFSGSFEFSGNVLNRGYIENLPFGCCVEVPCTADANGVHPHTVGALPTMCAALCQTNINEHTLMAEAITEKNREKAFQALLMDPMASTKLTLQTARQLFEEMWNREIELGIELI